MDKLNGWYKVFKMDKLKGTYKVTVPMSIEACIKYFHNSPYQRTLCKELQNKYQCETIADCRIPSINNSLNDSSYYQVYYSFLKSDGTSLIVLHGDYEYEVRRCAREIQQMYCEETGCKDINILKENVDTIKQLPVNLDKANNDLNELRKNISEVKVVFKEIDKIREEYDNLRRFLDDAIKVICCVCFEKTKDKTKCGHNLCNQCKAQLEKKICPYCRESLT